MSSNGALYFGKIPRKIAKLKEASLGKIAVTAKTNIVAIECQRQ